MNLLFLCVANSARSQLAEALAPTVFGSTVKVWSAGSRPGKLNPFAVAAMKEVGIDISRQWSKSTDDLPPDFVADLDYVITLCAEEVCPWVPSKAKQLHWPLKDPAGPEGTDAEKLQRFRETREELRKRLTALEVELRAPRPSV